MIIPIGISDGIAIVLETRSASVKRDAPRRKEKGISILLSGPINILIT